MLTRSLRTPSWCFSRAARSSSPRWSTPARRRSLSSERKTAIRSARCCAASRAAARGSPPGSAAATARAEEGRRRPEVYLFGAKELNRGDLTLLEPDWAAGIGVRFPLWDRADRPNRLRAARATERRVALLEADTSRQLHTLIEKNHREVLSAQDQFAALDETLALARESLRVRQLAFTEGHATSLEVVDAQLALARVETERARVAYEFVTALAALLEASGQPSRFFAYEARAEQRISP